MIIIAWLIMSIPLVDSSYPLVNVYIAMENHRV